MFGFPVNFEILEIEISQLVRGQAFPNSPENELFRFVEDEFFVRNPSEVSNKSRVVDHLLLNGLFFGELHLACVDNDDFVTVFRLGWFENGFVLAH